MNVLLVLGCPDLTLPDYTWYERNGSVATVGCRESDDVWHLQCEGGGWVGDLNNCTSEGNYLLFFQQ